MGFKDFLKRGTGLELVSGEESVVNKSSSSGGRQSAKQKKSDDVSNGGKFDDKTLKQLEVEVSRAIEKLEDILDKLRVRRGF